MINEMISGVAVQVHDLLVLTMEQTVWNIGMCKLAWVWGIPGFSNLCLTFFTLSKGTVWYQKH